MDVLFEKAITNVDGGDVERERYYNMALEVDGRVERMEGEMNKSGGTPSKNADTRPALDNS